MNHRCALTRPLILAVALAGVWGCQASVPLTSGSTPTTVPSDDAGTPVIPFSPLPIEAQTAKVKLLLTGEPVSMADVSQVKSQGMAAAVAAWQQSPSAQQKIIAMLSSALQQSASVAEDFEDQGLKIDSGAIGTNAFLLVQNLRESMARTVLAADAQNGSFFQTAMTTHTFQMTTPMVAYYVFLDAMQKNDSGKVTNLVGNADFIGTMASFVASDFTTWRPVTIRTPTANEKTNLPADGNFDALNTLILKTPRQGFMTTPSFFAVWQTNDANEARVTMNQALVVALGAVFDGTNVAQPASLAAIDMQHAAPNTPCYGCHINLDPMRQIYRQFYTIHFSAQTDPKQIALPGQFAYGGVSRQVSSSDDFGNLLASHPAVPVAWAQKLCSWANNTSCLPNDPELQRLAKAFAADGSFSKLLSGVLSSPLTTYASPTLTTKTNGVVFAVDKQDHLCPLLSERLGLPDVCGLAPGASPSGSMATLKTIASILPANGFSRGQAAPTQANDPTLFFRSGAENMCAILAAQVVDGASNKSFPSTDPAVAIGNMVHQLMGLPAGSGRDTTPIAILTDHFTQAVATGAKASEAMQSTFVSACLSPAVMGTAM